MIFLNYSYSRVLGIPEQQKSNRITRQYPPCWSNVRTDVTGACVVYKHFCYSLTSAWTRRLTFLLLCETAILVLRSKIWRTTINSFLTINNPPKNIVYTEFFSEYGSLRITRRNHLQKLIQNAYKYIIYIQINIQYTRINILPTIKYTTYN